MSDTERLSLRDLPPVGPVRIPLWRRDRSIAAFALVDQEWAASVVRHRWHLSNGGYGVRTLYDAGHFSKLFIHRLVMGLEPGDRRYVDHINLDKLDCRRSNLRYATYSQNAQNRRPRNITWTAWGWKAEITLDGKHYYLGLHPTLVGARAVVARFRRAHMPFSEEAA